MVDDLRAIGRRVKGAQEERVGIGGRQEIALAKLLCEASRERIAQQALLFLCGHLARRRRGRRSSGGQKEERLLGIGQHAGVARAEQSFGRLNSLGKRTAHPRARPLQRRPGALSEQFDLPPLQVIPAAQSEIGEDQRGQDHTRDEGGNGLAHRYHPARSPTSIMAAWATRFRLPPADSAYLGAISSRAPAPPPVLSDCAACRARLF